MIDIQNLKAAYGTKTVLNNINLNITTGITCIIGLNGCGKSTLIKCIARQLPISGGSITINDKPLNSFAQKQLAQTVSYLRQSRDIPVISVYSLALHGRFPYMGFPRVVSAHDKDIAKNALLKVGMWEMRDKFLSELSGGECQKAYIALTLTQDAPIMLLDEPATHLDIKYQLQLLQLLQQLKQNGKTIVTVFHDINDAIKIADNIILLDNSGVAFCGSPTNLLQSEILSKVFKVNIACIKNANQSILTFML